jgi:hypothetical protein
MTPTLPRGIHATRRARLDALARAYETSDVAGGDREHSRQADLKYIPGGRYVLVLGGPRSTYRLRVCDSVDAVERAAAEAILSADSHRAVCYFDFDELAGDPPPVDIGDEIRAGGQVLHVIGIEHDPSNGRRQIIANADPDADVDDPDSARLDEIDRDRYEIVVRLDEDERMPVRYAVAEVLVHVVFNRRPEPA